VLGRHKRESDGERWNIEATERRRVRENRERVRERQREREREREITSLALKRSGQFKET